MTPFYMYSEPLIIPPPPPGVQTVTDCGQPGVYVDNTDPINPVVCFGGVITDATLTGNGTLALPLSVVPPNIQVNIGKTLYVSKDGNNTTAVPYDIRKHYLTINAALTAAVAGDTIVVFPGTYTVTADLVKTGVNYYFMPGSTVTSNVLPVLFTVNAGQNIHIKGNGIFLNPNGGIIAAYGGTLSFDSHQCNSNDYVLSQTAGTVNFNCDTVSVINSAFVVGPSGTCTINVREYIRAGYRVFQFNDNCNVIVNCPTIYNNGTHAVYNTNGAFIIRLSLTTGKVIVNCDLMYSVNGNMVLIGSQQIADGSSFIGNIKRLINNYAGGTTHTILIANKCNYFQFNGNIYSNKAGQNIGLYLWNTNGPLYNSYVEFNGNIYNNLNYAILVQGGNITLNYSGDIYGKPEDIIATTPVGFGTLVYIQSGFNGCPISTVTFNSCLFYVGQSNGIAVYKDMQLDGGGLEQDNICQLLDCGIYLLDAFVPVCDGLFVIQPNNYVTSGSISNGGFVGTATDATGGFITYPRFTLNIAPIAD